MQCKFAAGYVYTDRASGVLTYLIRQNALSFTYWNVLWMGLKVGQPDVYEPISSHNGGSSYVLRNDYKK
jgi:hypothetical protein